VLVVPCPRGTFAGPEITNVGGSTLRVNVVVAVTLPEVPVIVKFLVSKGVELLEISVNIV
jgi:hypothetical protein